MSHIYVASYHPVAGQEGVGHVRTRAAVDASHGIYLSTPTGNPRCRNWMRQEVGNHILLLYNHGPVTIQGHASAVRCLILGCFEARARNPDAGEDDHGTYGDGDCAAAVPQATFADFYGQQNSATMLCVEEAAAPAPLGDVVFVRSPRPAYFMWHPDDPLIFGAGEVQVPGHPLVDAQPFRGWLGV